MNSGDEQILVRSRFDELRNEARAIADINPDARALVPTLEAIVGLVNDHPAQHSLIDTLLASLVEQGDDFLPLSHPGVVAILEFSMHRLRSSKVRAALLELERSAGDWRVKRAAERILEAFDDEWEVGEIYGELPHQ